MSCELIVPETLWRDLEAHVFRGDDDKHGAVIVAGVARSGSRLRLLARHLFTAEDSVHYIRGQRGYRMLTAEFIRERVLFCRDEGLAYLAVHNHGGHDSVTFSRDDLRSHERGYPALRDIVRGQIVGGIVVARNAVAGDLWLPNRREPLKLTKIVGQNLRELFSSPPPRPARAPPAYDRQARLFGDRGQALLRRQRVGIIGLGGIGSLVCEYLARLGVGSLVLVDPDRLEPTNVPRVVGSTMRDAGAAPNRRARSGRKRSDASPAARLKVSIAAREARRANPRVVIIEYPESVVEGDVARDLADCDFLFLTADSMQARLVFNAIVHQYLVPGLQLGTKVPVDPDTGRVGRVFAVVRPVLPSQGCLWCNGLINPTGLQNEALSEQERRVQRYVDEQDIPAPSIISLNALAAAHGVNDYLFRLTGLRDKDVSDDYIYIEPRTGIVRLDTPRSDRDCLECGVSSASRLARGDSCPLPVKSKGPG